MHSKNRDRCPKSNSKLLVQYLEFLQHHQFVAEATIVIRKIFVSQFLKEIYDIATPSRLCRLSARTVHDYVISKSPDLHRSSKKHLVSSLRSFLRFAHVRGYIKRNLVEAVPVIATRKLESVPRGIPWSAVKALLRAPDRRTHGGRRDYAIILLLATYGVRIGQAMQLKLSAIHWRAGLIHFEPSKGGKPLQFPLKDEVAHALLSYIKRDRGQLPFPEVFLTMPPKRHPFSQHNHFGTRLNIYYKRAGLDLSLRGAHAIRHAFATRLIEKGVSIKTIADLLGHRWIETTFIYTKVDVPHLRSIAREWPEVVS